MVIAIAGVLSCSGCSARSTSLNTVFKADRQTGAIRRIAVLPFMSETMEEHAGEIATRAFVEGLFSRNMDVEFDGNVKRLLVNERIVIRKNLSADQILLVGKRLNVDAVIIGWVDKYVGQKRGKGSLPFVSLTARMVSVRDGSIVWIGHNSRAGRDFETILGYGRITSPVLLMRKVVNELIDTMT